MRSGIGLTKPARVVSWKQPDAPRTMKTEPAAPTKKKALTAENGDTATVRDILDGGETPQVVVEPLAPDPDDPGRRGTVLLVPKGLDYYFSLAYISGEEGSLTVSLPQVQGILVMDLPKGMFTPTAEINAAIDSGTGGGPPGIVGPSSP